jgi:hypothetical protein
MEYPCEYPWDIPSVFDQDLGDHPKAAIGYHFKTGHRETA